MKVTSFIVEGKGKFPFDMLRYDLCFPCDGTSSHNVAIDTPDARSVKLISMSGNGITPDRWASFGWGVIPWTTKVYDEQPS